MCGAALAIAGAAVSGIGSIMGASAQANAQEAQADFHDQQARLERQRGAYMAGQEDRKNNKLAGRQRNIAANSGVTMDSFGDVMEASEAEGNLDEQAIRFSAETKAMAQNKQAEMKRAEASATRSAGMIGAISPLIKGIGGMSGGATFNPFGSFG